MSYKKRIAITGGAGFIGSHMVRLLVNKYPEYLIVNFDKLTYAGNLENLVDIENKPNYIFLNGDVCSEKDINGLFETHQISDIIHLAAESHVDRSIDSPNEFVNTNVIGTVNLLQCANKYWANKNEHIFYHVSTDEVYGSLGETGLFTEKTSYDPRSPYSAAKAASDHFVRAFSHTYGLSIKISNCSNNYGSHHFPEKLIPLMIHNIMNNKELPIYGKGDNIRDWLWVEDHVAAIDLIFHKGVINETYNIGGLNEWTNLDLVKYLCDKMDEKLNRNKGESQKLIRFVKDRAGHDQRYAIDASKLCNGLNWKPSVSFEEGLDKTINWYIDNQKWVDQVTSGSYQEYYKKHYHNR